MRLLQLLKPGLQLGVRRAQLTVLQAQHVQLPVAGRQVAARFVPLLFSGVQFHGQGVQSLLAVGSQGLRRVQARNGACRLALRFVLSRNLRVRREQVRTREAADG